MHSLELMGSLAGAVRDVGLRHAAWARDTCTAWVVILPCELSLLAGLCEWLLALHNFITATITAQPCSTSRHARLDKVLLCWLCCLSTLAVTGGVVCCKTTLSNPKLHGARDKLDERVCRSAAIALAVQTDVQIHGQVQHNMCISTQPARSLESTFRDCVQLRRTDQRKDQNQGWAAHPGHNTGHETAAVRLLLKPQAVLDPGQVESCPAVRNPSLTGSDTAQLFSTCASAPAQQWLVMTLLRALNACRENGTPH